MRGEGGGAPVRPGPPRPTSAGPLVTLEITLFAVVFVAGGALTWLALLGERGRQAATAPGPGAVAPPVAGPTGPGGTRGGDAPTSAELGAISGCLEAAGFAVEDNSEVHPETVGSLRITRGSDLLFVFLFATPDEARGFQEGFGPEAPLVVNLGKVIVEYTSPPSQEVAGPVESCSEPFA
jgi:hypothetical protein